MPHAFSQRLAAGALLCDGAMGTMLYARGVSLDACFDVLNLNNPRLVQAIHADYVAAGADLIETNTFGANRFKLAVHGLEGQVREVNRRGVRLARDVRESTGRDVLILGSVGPLGKYLAPLGSVTAEDAARASSAVTLPRGARYLPSGPTEPRIRTSRPVDSRTSRASRTPRRLTSRTWPSSPCTASLKRLAPKVLVSIRSAPAAT